MEKKLNISLKNIKLFFLFNLSFWLLSGEVNFKFILFFFITEKKIFVKILLSKFTKVLQLVKLRIYITVL